VTDRFRQLWPYLAAGALVMVISIAYGVVEPGFGGDSTRYLLVARNILFNGCVSISEPRSGACIAHWGGNQFPGYPAFLAAAGFLAGLEAGANPADFAMPAIILQSATAGLAAARLGWAAERFTNAPRTGLICALVVGFSPLHFAWSRWLLTEMVSIAIAIWVLAELLLSLRDGRLRVVPLALALTVGFFFRFDAIALCAAVVPVAFFIHSPMTALRRGVVIAVLMALPVAAWSTRNVAHGLSVYPVPSYGLGHGKGQGYYDWLSTWVTDLYMGARAAYPAANRRYSQIKLAPQAYLDDKDRPIIDELLRRWGQHDGEAIPRWIDQKFHELTVERRHRDPMGTWLITPARRALFIWGAPAYSFGWNVELGDAAREHYAHGSWTGLLDVALKNPGKILAKIGVAMLHLMILGAFGILLLSQRAMAPNLRPVIWATSAYVLTKTVFVTLLGQADPRLSVEAYPFFEAVLVVALMFMPLRVPGQSGGKPPAIPL
jgi:hypothetical protein